MNNNFFEKSKESSLVKTRIVEKYFKAWTDIIVPRAIKRNTNIGYVDLFAGPGIYEDGSKSTPILILEQALKNKDICDRLVSVFNDVDSKSVRKLESSIQSIEGIDALKYNPIIENTEIGEGLTDLLEYVKGIPVLYFVDPWGYKGLSLELISATVREWGCDCIFFFNYNRINIDINNPIVINHMDSLFGSERAEALRNSVDYKDPSQREFTILEAISQSLKAEAGEYVLPFCFKKEEGKRTSHHLIFVSKNKTAYKIMKEIMAKESSEADQGVPSFVYNPATRRQPFLFELTRPLDDLADMLLTTFVGRKMTINQIFDEHNVDRPYIEKNYREILIKLETEGKILTKPPANERQKRKGTVTFSNKVQVKFPNINM